MLDKYAAMPIFACAFALIIDPVLIYFVNPPPYTLESIMAPRFDNRIVWPTMAAISVFAAVRNRSRLASLARPPHLLCLMAYVALAGASVLWAFKPEISLIRFLQQLMIVVSIVVPAILAARTTDMMRALFLCFAFASIINIFFVLGGDPIMAEYGSENVAIGYPGYFTGKNYLGECAALAFLLSLHEMLYPGVRRALGIIVVVIAVVLVFVSDSKTAFALAFVAPFLAALTLFVARKMRISPAIVLLMIPLCYMILSSVSNFNINRLSYMVYGDSTLTGRTLIWDFVQTEIERRPLLGWGYQCFWLVGSDGPSIVEAPGWIKNMPNAHNGYYDTTVELGYVGYAVLLAFILSTLHGIGRIAERDAPRAWLVLSLVLYIICFNYLESLWMRGFEFLWVVFLILVAEIGRYYQALPQPGAGYGFEPGGGSPESVPGKRRLRLEYGLSRRNGRRPP